ncbi:hypothetical protein V1478_002043 [Vespula squamosa]|uniref:Uncharacterized protein n=1 Tax=Vespula squamosa TaxID=30214 RepID=A0ABD2BYU6_VESSQ
MNKTDISQRMKPDNREQASQELVWISHRGWSKERVITFIDRPVSTLKKTIRSETMFKTK